MKLTDEAILTAKVEQIAQVAHDANAAYCRTLGDMSQLPWDLAYEWQRESKRKGVRAALSGELTSPWEQHEAWMTSKLADGWTWGKDKDPVMKTHPCLVPYGELPPEQQKKDVLFRAIIEALK